MESTFLSAVDPASAPVAEKNGASGAVQPEGSAASSGGSRETGNAHVNAQSAAPAPEIRSE